MNDLDMRAALHRDADLVGDPSPDLLDQLVRRRAHQRRQRAGLIAVAAAVALIGAGIPVVSSLTMRSHAAPATQTGTTTVEETTSPAVTPALSPAPTPTPSVTPASPAPANDTPACIAGATARSMLVASTGDDRFGVDAQSGPFCAGPWAVVIFTHSDETGAVRTHANWLFQWVDGSWQLRPRTQLLEDCTSGQVPAAIFGRACNSD